MEHLIELKDVYKIYQMGEETVHALDGISLTVDPGEFVAIVGSSGSGKSTAMNIIGCLDVPTSGTYHLGGVDVSTMDDDDQAEIRNKMLGFIFQQYNLIPKLNTRVRFPSPAPRKIPRASMAPGIFPFYVVPNFCKNRGHMQANFCFCVSQSVSQFWRHGMPRRSFAFDFAKTIATVVIGYLFASNSKAK